MAAYEVVAQKSVGRGAVESLHAGAVAAQHGVVECREPVPVLAWCVRDGTSFDSNDYKIQSARESICRRK